MTAATESAKIRPGLGVALAAGVPVLVLVSMGPVAALVGTASVLVWVVAAVIGFFMALAFAELAASHPRLNGGVAVAAAEVLATRSPLLARIGQWSYWFGWSPALAINGLLVGGYVQQLLAPGSPQWIPAAVGIAVLIGSATVNHFGMRVGARLQLVLVVSVTGVVVLLFAAALVRGNLRVVNLQPFGPPGGWLSSAGWLGIAGGLFVAGWSAYGSELALAYATRYRSGLVDAVRVLMGVAVASVVAFGLVPLLLLAVVGIDGVRADPAHAFQLLTERSIGPATNLVLAFLVLALLLGLNMIAIASSWTLRQMAVRGDAWKRLGGLNRHGMPANALRFDVTVNIALIVVVTVLAGGRTAEVPIALLAAANVGYFVSMSLALAAAWLNHRRPRRRGLMRLRGHLMAVAPPLALLNLVLVVTAGHAWGWRNVGTGLAVLGLIIVVLALRRPRREPAPAVAASMPMCWGRPEYTTDPHLRT